MHVILLRSYKNSLPMLIIGLLSMLVSPLLPSPQHVQAQAVLPAVSYDALNRTIFVGVDYNPADPNQAPYADYPSHPDAPKQDITLAQIDSALGALGLPDLITNNGNTWVLKNDLVILETARLNVNASSVAELQLDSSETYPDGSSRPVPFLTKLIARGGALVFDGVHVYSAVNGQPDTDRYNGRSYLLAENGGRMDVLNSEITHLGWASGEPSGMAWRKMGKEDGDPTKTEDIRTGATGSIKNSKMHDMYFGQYSYEAYGLVVTNNEFYNNEVYGFDPHDYSTGFEVAYNKVFNNGKHGIIFSRGCTLNRIHHNEVWGNQEHGIMLDRGSNVNQIYNNLVYNNSDGVAIFQSEKNLIKENTLINNERGVRINATYDVGDIFDGLSNENVVLNNIIRDNTQYGIYLYERADKNTIQGNTIEGSAASGIYIKTGGNIIRANTIRTNDSGITIVGGDPITVGDPGGQPPYIEPSYEGGHKNGIYGNTISDNNSIGVQLRGAVDTTIGLDGPNPKATDANIISTNGTHGISMSTGATKNIVRSNTIHGNGGDGVLIKDATSIKNLISQNSITANGRSGINLQDQANENIPTPQITSAADATTVTGKIEPMQTKYRNSTIEVYRDAAGQGKVYLGKTTLQDDGTWSFALPANDDPNNGQITALLIDTYKNTSMFGGNTVGGNTVTYQIGQGSNGETTVFISGPGANVSLPDIQRALKTISPTVDLVKEESPGSKVWQLNTSLFLNRGVSITLSLDTVSWLKLRSQGSDIQLATADEAKYMYKSFTALRTYNGSILISGTPQQHIKISSWDPTQNDYDRDISNGRSYLLAKYNARMDIKYADVMFLGSSDGESYGVAWRDINSSEQPTVLQARVTGNVTDSTFSYNYYGIYTFQASNMQFLRNKFHNNIGYGFDPHDYSTNFLVEDNEAFENGNHGFIISRGCNNFVIRGNKSYNNKYSVDTAERRAHGFMLDPGSPNSRFPQVPSTNNLLENNQAYGNDGYGLRIVGSNTNTIRNNSFSNNSQGMTIEQGSTGNIVTSNTITASGQYGIYLFSAADANTITNNTITGSGKHGIYIKTGRNTVTGNTVSNNGQLVNGVTSGSGIATLLEQDIFAAAADMTLAGVAVDVASYAADTGIPAAVSEVTQNVISGNSVTNNIDEGIELKGATATTLEQNTVSGNGSNGIYLANGTSSSVVRKNSITANAGYGIRANGYDVFGNMWSQNVIYANRNGGIITTSSANDAIKPPTITRDGNKVSGTTRPNATVELYSDNAGQGRVYETTLKADANGYFETKRGWKGTIVNAFATDDYNNSSGFAINQGSIHVFVPLIRR